ncbi:MAG: protein kinase [Myxococcales bacterium]|nr:protein kinase [Polyangiaceae bacterium]MDW8250336.1 protein kinase [Myxococcales bacterium]
MKVCPQCNLRYPDESQQCFVDGTALQRMTDPRIGTTVAGRYLIESVLGEGGMAMVYKARHKLVDRPCAIKIMNPALARDRVVRERFRREAKAAQKLAHPNIIEIFDHGDTEDGTAFLVMELLQGESLADALANQGKLPLVRALPIGIQIARALARAHDFEVVHRDLKPENIFLSIAPDGSELVKLLDFGIARSMHDTRLTGVGEVFGTPQYMAPERITSIDAGPPADLYALGIILFEMLTGRLPFDAPDIPSFFVKHLKEPPPRIRTLAPQVPPALEDLIDRLLKKDAKQRPVDAHSVHADLIAICQQQGIPVPPEPSQPSSSPEQEPPHTLPPVAIDRWAQRVTIFEQMLERVYGKQSPPELRQLLGEVRHLVHAVAELRKESVAEQRKMEIIEQKEREGRQRFGFAMDALGIDASVARQQVRASQEALLPLQQQLDAMEAEGKKAHREIICWEGRWAFREPYPQLSAAYRAAADLIDRWYALRQQQKEAQALLEERERMVNDLDYQIRELRNALSAFEKNMEAEKAAQHDRISSLDKKAGMLEAELLALSARFCAPLRGRPELSSYFKELEGAAA